VIGDSKAGVVAKAAASDVVVACLGEPNYTEKPGDISDLSLPTGQLQLLWDLVNAGEEEEGRKEEEVRGGQRR